MTDKLKSYSAAKQELLPNTEHRQYRGLNNRALYSHRPTRIRERRMGRFKSTGHAQQFLSPFESIREHFHPKQHLLSAYQYRQVIRQRFETWRQVTYVIPISA